MKIPILIIVLALAVGFVVYMFFYSGNTLPLENMAGQETSASPQF